MGRAQKDRETAKVPRTYYNSRIEVEGGGWESPTRYLALLVLLSFFVVPSALHAQQSAPQYDV
jgi:hypothetical protein